MFNIKKADKVYLSSDDNQTNYVKQTSGLDPGQRIAFKKYISRLASDRIVIIFTHVVSDIAVLLLTNPRKKI